MRRQPSKTKMKITTINISEESFIFLDALVEHGIAPSRSELIRKCITDSMPMLFEMYNQRQAIVKEIQTNHNFLTPNDIIFVKDARHGRRYTKYQILGEA